MEFWTALASAVRAAAQGDAATLFTALLGACFAWAVVELTRDHKGAPFADWLEKPEREGLYQRMARACIARLDGFLVEGRAASHRWPPAEGGPVAEAQPRAAVARSLFDSCLRLAFVYPLILFYLNLVLEARIVPAESLGAWGWPVEAVAKATMAAIPLALAFGVHRALGPVARDGAIASVRFDRWTIAAFLLALGATAVEAWAEIGSPGMLLTFAFPAFAALALGFPAGLALLAYSAAFNLMFNAASWLAGRVSLAGAASDAVGFAAVLLHTLAFTASLAIGLLMLRLLRDGGAGRTHRRRWYLGALLVQIAALYAVAAFMIAPPLASWELYDVSARMLVIFGAFPVANAAFDFLSLLTTRALVRAGLDRPALAPLLGALDLAAAVALFVGLGAASVALIHLLNVAHGFAGAPVDLWSVGRMLGELGSEDGLRAQWWIPMALFSTLAPTMLHAAIALFALIAWLPKGFRLWLARQIRAAATDTNAFIAASLGIAFVGAIHVAAPIAAIVLAVSLSPGGATAAAGAYLTAMEAFARAIGAM